jgi:hypothetical protein
MASSVKISSMDSCYSGSAYIAPGRASLAGADGMEGGHRAGAQPFDELGVGLDHRSMRKFVAAIGIERPLRDDLARYADAGDHCAPVKLGPQVVRPDSGRRRRIGRAQGAALPKPSSTSPHASRHSGSRSCGQSVRISISARLSETTIRHPVALPLRRIDKNLTRTSTFVKLDPDQNAKFSCSSCQDSPRRLNCALCAWKLGCPHVDRGTIRLRS